MLGERVYGKISFVKEKIGVDSMIVINIICAVISLITILQCGINIIKKAVYYMKDLQYLKRVLQFGSNSCCIELSLFKKEESGAAHDYITFYAVKSYEIVSELLKKMKVSVDPIDMEYSDNKNKIYIGGPGANIGVNAILTKFSGFKFYGTYSQRKNTDNPAPHYLVYSEEKRGFMFGNKFYEIEKNLKDVGVFIRIPRDEKKGILYTTHIIFAAWDIGTYKAVEFFVNNYKTICRRFENKPYCFVIPISRVDNTARLLSVNEIEDVSKEFFSETNIVT